MLINGECCRAGTGGTYGCVGDAVKLLNTGRVSGKATVFGVVPYIGGGGAFTVGAVVPYAADMMGTVVVCGCAVGALDRGTDTEDIAAGNVEVWTGAG